LPTGRWKKKRHLRKEEEMMAAELIVDLVGDVNLKRDGKLDESVLTHVSAELSRADVRFGNLEGAFADPNVELPYKPGWFHCEPEMVNCLKGLFDGLACANNTHYGPAIMESHSRLDQIGILHAGAGANRADARKPAIFKKGDTTFGLLSYTSVFWPIGHSATESSPGVASIKGYTSYEPSLRIIEMPGAPAVVHSWPDQADLAAVVEDIRELRKRVDTLVVYFHWGVSGSPEVTELEQIVGRAAVDSGADIVVGAHPHTPQAIEFYKGGVILYSMGNFCFGWKLHRLFTREGILARVKVSNGKVTGCSVVPVQRNEADQAVFLDPGTGDGKRIFESLAALCAKHGTKATVSGDEIVLTPAGIGGVA
jgi:poly-gamma-glutamate capsule biosynthesis protein CapA/YwtB (metallophosphatase superfamily)